VTDGQTARLIDGQTGRRTRQKQYVSPRGGGDITKTGYQQISECSSHCLVYGQAPFELTSIYCICLGKKVNLTFAQAVQWTMVKN